MQIVVRPAVAADIGEAFLWYEGQRACLGHEFLVAAQRSIDAIAEHPLGYPIVRRNTSGFFSIAFLTASITACMTTLSLSSRACTDGVTLGDGNHVPDV